MSDWESLTPFDAVGYGVIDRLRKHLDEGTDPNLEAEAGSQASTSLNVR